jgi:DNA gyrase/topoisomerase IV subunit A
MEEDQKYGFLGLGDETDAGTLITAYMEEFSKELCIQKSNHLVDGLNKVTRRILYGIKDKPMKKVHAQVSAVNEYHPSGDASIGKTMSRMMQPWVFPIPLLDHQGGIGCYAGDKAGKPRYLEGKISEFSKDLFFFPNMERTINMVEVDGEDFLEPEYFIPKIPTTLLLGTTVIGSGFYSKAPQYNLNDIVNLVLETINIIHEKKDIRKEIDRVVKYLIPDFPTYGLLRNKRQIEDSIRKLDFDYRMLVDGTMSLSSNIINIRSLPNSIALNTISKKMTDMMIDKKSWFQNILEFKDVSGGIKNVLYADFEFSFKQNKDIFEYLSKIKKITSFSQNESFKYNLFYKNRFKAFTPLEILEYWMEERYYSISSQYGYEAKRQYNKLRRLEALLKIQDHIDDVINIIRTSEDDNIAKKRLSQKFNITLFQAGVIAEMKIIELTKSKSKNLVVEKDIVINKIKEINYSISNIYEKIYSDAEWLKNKYGKIVEERRTKTPDFNIGVNIINKTHNGFIQLHDIDELNKKLNSFKTAKDIDVFYYPSYAYKYNIKSTGIETEEKYELPKEDNGYLLASSNKLKYTVILDDGKIFYTKGLYLVEGKKTFHVSDNVLLIDKFGKIKECPTVELPYRKSINASGNLTEIENVINIPGKNYFIAHMNSKDKNILRISNFSDDDIKEIKTLPTGKTDIVCIGKINNPLLAKIPDIFLNRIAKNIIFIKDVKKVLGNEKHIYLNLRNFKKNKNILIYK